MPRLARQLQVQKQRPRGANEKRGENKMAKKAIKRLKKSTKVESGKTLHKLGIG
jgi:hypothetical protein